MVLDSTVMNVSISAVVDDLDSSVTAMQSAITFYTLTMGGHDAAGRGDIWGRRRARGVVHSTPWDAALASRREGDAVAPEDRLS